MAKYKQGQKLTYKPLNMECTVDHVTPYHDSDDQHAVVWVKLRTGDLRSVPVATQDAHLTTEPPTKVSPIRKVFGRLG